MFSLPWWSGYAQGWTEKWIPSMTLLLLVSATPVGTIPLLGEDTMDSLFFSFLRC
jgi:hypothetical protein